MSDCSYACILCGFPICSSSTWLCEYRAVYCDPLGPSITGVGRYNGNASWIAPYDLNLRWDNIIEQDSQVEVPVMEQSPDAGRHGFVLHEACYCLLRKAFEPGPVPLKRLLSICSSLPFPLRTDGICWGHNYSGLLVWELQNTYPWCEQFSWPEDRTQCFSDARINPLEFPDLSIILSHKSNPPTHDNLTQTAAQDCFSSLPWEMREQIAILLSTTDALNLRIACRSFLPIYSSSTFWASRFEKDGERGYLFEARDIRDVTQLMNLYRITRARICPPGLRNRRRIWKLVLQITTIANQAYSDDSAYASSSKLASEGWIRLAGDEKNPLLNQSWQLFSSGCRSVSSAVLLIPQGLKQIGITTVKIGASSYVTGIRFLGYGEKSIRAGYFRRENESAYNLEALHGFRVAIGIGGIRALQIIGEQGSTSGWIGRATHVPVSERLVLSQDVRAVKVTFDMTGLALPFQQEPISSALHPPIVSMRQAGMWYPRVPPKELYLNDGSFTGQSPLSTGYRPFLWTHFGGQRGKYLDRLVGISADYSHGLHGLAFIYDDYGDSCLETPPSQLGRIDPEEQIQSSRFAIGGSAGERIMSIEVGIRRYEDPRAYDFCKYGALEGVRVSSPCLFACQIFVFANSLDHFTYSPILIQMTTNLGRVFEVGNLYGSVQIQHLPIAKETTITGLYSSHDNEFGLISLGVISEML